MLTVASADEAVREYLIRVSAGRPAARVFVWVDRGADPALGALMRVVFGLGLAVELVARSYRHNAGDPVLAQGEVWGVTAASEAEQVEAWVELVELSQDPDFRASMRRMTEQHAAERVQGDNTLVRRDAAAMVRDQVGPALIANTDPASPEADPVVAAVTAFSCSQ